MKLDLLGELGGLGNGKGGLRLMYMSFESCGTVVERVSSELMDVEVME